jgi:hypothetical protein
MPMYREKQGIGLLCRERRQRCCTVHRRNRPKEAQIVSLSRKETGRQNAVQRTVSLQQVSGALWADTTGAWQLV